MRLFVPLLFTVIGFAYGAGEAASTPQPVPVPGTGYMIDLNAISFPAALIIAAFLITRAKIIVPVRISTDEPVEVRVVGDKE